MKLSVSVFLFVVGFCATSAQSTDAIGAKVEQEGDSEFDFVVNGFAGEATTSRSWDCCKPSCASAENIGKKVGPVHSCNKDGTTVGDSSIKSICDGGSSYVCNNQQSSLKSPKLAYGFASAAFLNPPENMCCACFLLTFQKGPDGDCSGKQMIVQITNSVASNSTAGNFSNIEINIPGGGVGKYTTGCSSQWDVPATGWGAQFGGVTTEAECSTLPAALHAGCKFRWNYLNGCSNPPATFRQVVCPLELVTISGCSEGPKAA